MSSNKLLGWLSDETYLNIIYFLWTKKRLNLKYPKTFNEKIQRLKLYNRNPKYCQLADKLTVKDIIAKRIGQEHIIPTLGVRENFENIDFKKLPDKFVLKCNHDSGSVFICKNKKQLNKKYVKEKIDNSLKKNFYDFGKEWPYKNIKPKIFAEKYMVDESGRELKDYKVFCFNGKPEFIQVDYDRFINHKRNIYDLKRNLLPFEIEYPADGTHIINKPKCLDEMLNFSRILSKNIPHLRCDFYVINEKIYFGELTFYHGSGFEIFQPSERGIIIGDKIKLPLVKTVKNMN